MFALLACWGNLFGCLLRRGRRCSPRDTSWTNSRVYVRQLCSEYQDIWLCTTGDGRGSNLTKHVKYEIFLRGISQGSQFQFIWKLRKLKSRFLKSLRRQESINLVLTNLLESMAFVRVYISIARSTNFTILTHKWWCLGIESINLFCNCFQTSHHHKLISYLSFKNPFLERCSMNTSNLSLQESRKLKVYIWEMWKFVKRTLRPENCKFGIIGNYISA